MYCEHCGVQLAPGADTCHNCGAKVIAAGAVNENTQSTAGENTAAQGENGGAQQNQNCPPPNFNGGANPNCPPPNFNGGANPNCPPPNFNGGANPNCPPPNYGRQPYQPYPPYPPYPPQANPNDKKSTGLNVLSFLFPIVGLILWLATRDDRPVRAKSIAKSALIGFIFGIVVSFLSTFIIIFSALGIRNSSGLEDYGSFSEEYSYDFDADSDYDSDYFNDFMPE